VPIQCGTSNSRILESVMQNRAVMKSLRILTFFAVALILAPALFAAEFGIRAGRYNEAETEFVGAELLFDIGALNINPNVEYLLEDDVTAGTANLDVTFDVISTARVTPYVGAGVGLAYSEVGDASAKTDIVGNLIGGVSFDLDFLEPYAQLKYFRLFDNENGGGDDDEFALTIGLRF
jgi:opacity protein-like surface antigen